MAASAVGSGGPVPPRRPVVARVRADGRIWALGRGGRLTFGRAGCDIPFGTQPEDLMISRHAGTLAESEGALVIRNSGRHPLHLLNPEGDTHQILSPGTAGSAGLADFQIVAVGTYGQRHEIMVHHQHQSPVLREQDTVQMSVRLTRTERRLLAALCEQRLTSGDPHAPLATYREIARRVSRDDNYVRSRLSAVRSNLAGLGIPGLAQTEPGPAARRLPDYIVRLGDWVLAAGLITETDLALIDPDPTKEPS